MLPTLALLTREVCPGLRGRLPKATWILHPIRLWTQEIWSAIMPTTYNLTAWPDNYSPPK